MRYPIRGAARPPRNPFLSGFTANGVRVETDEQLRPKLRGRIREDRDRVQIVAGSEEEAKRLLERVRRNAAAEGMAAKIVGRRTEHVRPWITAQISLDACVWGRFAAKLALGVAAEAYPDAWRRSADAVGLRAQMRDLDPRDAKGQLMGLVPGYVRRDDVLRSLGPPAHHVLHFQMDLIGRVHLVALVFGEIVFSQVVDTSGAPAPDVAWVLDPRRPRADGRTTWNDVLVGAVQRASA